jgi:hopanoid biosynthesis associated protein HpnK
MSRRGLLLVTADDFGASVAANDAIEAAYREGIVTSTSLMVNEPAAADAAERARELPDLSVGLHLVLCDGAPASAPRTIPDLVEPSGRFPADPARAGLALWWRRRSLRDQVDREIRAQIERHLATGLPLDHVDGHHHLHLHPVVFERLARCLAEYKVGWVRLVHEDALARHGLLSGGASEWTDPVPAIFIALSAFHRRRLARRATAGGPDRVYGLRASGLPGGLDEAEWLRLLPRLRAPIVEIYAHPRRDHAQGRREEAALRSPAVRRAVSAAGYALVGTRALAHGVRGGET